MTEAKIWTDTRRKVFGTEYSIHHIIHYMGPAFQSPPKWANIFFYYVNEV